jgi:hypothetical protein
MALKKLQEAYVGIVMDMALARSKISNRMVAQRLGVTRRRSVAGVKRISSLSALY